MSSHAPGRRLLPESWRVRLPVFEGPLDLLLHLIRLNRVEITDIPIALVCDQFQEYLSLMEELDLDIAGEYIYEASLLIQLKSKLLLPRAVEADGEPEDAEQARQDLVRRLLEYRRLKEAAQALAEVDQLRQGVWTRPRSLPGVVPDEEELDLGEVSLFDLMGAFNRVLVRYAAEHPEPLIVRPDEYPVRNQVERLVEAVVAGRPFDLLADLATRSCRAEVIAVFLAVLEVARLQLVRIHQTADGQILLYRTTRPFRREELERLEETER